MSVAALPSTRTVGETLIGFGRTYNSALYELVQASADFDDSGEWVADNSPTAAHWIADTLDIEVCTAREWIRIGRLLRKLPAIDAAFAARRVSYSKVRALTRIATPENETQLLEIARAVPAGQLRTALARWSEDNEDADVRNARHLRNRGLWWRTEPDGMTGCTVNLPPFDMGKVLAAVDAAVMRRQQEKRSAASADAPYLSLAQQRADALVDLVTSGGSRVETEVIVHVRGDGCSLDDGTPIPQWIVERVAPSSMIRALIHDASSRPINASSRQRHPTERQKRVVKERDRRCIDCGSVDLPNYDHVPDFDESQRTLVDELFLRCSRCHRLRHKRRG